MHTAVNTPNAPKPLARYNQATIAGNTIYVSALFAQDPVTGEMVTGNIKDETIRVLENVKAVLEACGADFRNVVKLSIYLKDLSHYAVVNEIYGQYVQEPFPARETFQAAGLPLNVNIEIAVIAVKD